MKESFLRDGISFDLYRGRNARTVYILVPRGLAEEVDRWAEEASMVHGASVVMVRGMDWNNDLTPWPAPGVFRKAKPFEGKADAFLREFSGTMVPWFEGMARIVVGIRTIVGISLSGLFAVWAAFHCGTFQEVAAISGSLWYDGFAGWALEREPDQGVRRIYISLGDREKKSKDARMSTVEDCTEMIVKGLEKNVEVRYVLEEDVTHFSPIVPRLERLFLYLQEQPE